MRKFISFFISLVLVMVTLSYGCTRKGINKITISPLSEEIKDSASQWKEPTVKASLKPYKVKQDLSNVSNIAEFGELDSHDKDVLSEHLFMIKRPDLVFEQPFNIYEKNAQDGIPNLITSDSVLHVYHLMHDYIIKNIEKDRLVDELKEFTEYSFRKAIEVYNGTKEPNARKAALKNTAYFGIAMRLLNIDLPGGIPLEANRIIDNDVKKVKSRWNSGTSEIFPYYIDYKNYLVKGHYSRETEYANYFLTMMWYGNTPMLFEQYDNNAKGYKRMDEQIAMSVIMSAQTLGDENLRKLWDDIYRVSTVYFGNCGDISIYDMSDIVKTVYGEKLDFNKMCSDDKLQKVYELAKQRYNMHLSQTIGGRIELSNNDQKQQAQFRLTGQIYNLETDIYDNLTLFATEDGSNLRQLPKGLDIASAFGNDTAYSVLKEQIEEDKVWEDYQKSIVRIRGVLSGSNNPLDYSFGNSLFWIVKNIVKPYPAGYPSFMLDKDYSYKTLLTYVGAVSDSRHLSANTARNGESKVNVLVREQNLAIPGYVEPDISLYSKLEYMSKFMKSFLSSNGFTDQNIYNAIDSFTGLVEFLRQVSVKELENKPLTEAEDSRIKDFDKELKSVTLNTVEGKGSTKQWEMVPKVDRNMASVSDAYMNDNQVLQTAIGSPDYIYAVVPYNGKLYLTRGSVYSYYEFTGTTSKRLRDNEWQNMLNDGKEIEQENWIKSVRLP